MNKLSIAQKGVWYLYIFAKAGGAFWKRSNL